MQPSPGHPKAELLNQTESEIEMSKQARLFDKRVIDRNIDKGLITQADVAEYLSNLPDRESESELLLVDSDDNDDVEDAKEESTPESSYNFDAPENDGPKNVYDF